MSKNEYYQSQSDVAFSYKEVENGLMHMPKYITWDNVIDVFLVKQYSTSILQKNEKSSIKDYQFESDDLYQKEMEVSSIHSSVRIEEGEVEESFNKF